MKLQSCSIWLCCLLLTAWQSNAIVGIGIEKDCTNVVISWPSQGYEHYLVQHRATLAAETPWTNLTNNYPANSTNRTTFTVFAVAAPCDGGGESLMDGGESGIPFPLLVTKDGSKQAMPLGIFPPGMDLSGYIIVWPDGSTDEWSEELVEKWNANQQEGQGGSETEDSVDPEVTSGFYRVFHIPDWAFTVTNYVYDGPQFFPMDFKDYLDRVENIEVLLNGEATTYAELMSLYYNNQTNWGMGIYFDRIPSGTYQIQLQTTIRLSDDTTEDSHLLVLTNLAREIVVDNEVTFTNWLDLIWNNTNYSFQAQLKNPDTDWSIEIYDAWGIYVNGMSGHTTNGLVEWTWDLTDTNSNLRDSLENDPFFDPYITFEPSGPSLLASSSSTTRPMPIPVIAYPEVGNWIVTFQDGFFEPGTSSFEHFTNGLVGIAGGPALRGIPVSLIPLKCGTNNYTQTDRDNSWAVLKAYMFSPETRNLYYYGHGSGTGIGADYHTTNENGRVTGGRSLRPTKAYLTSKTVRDQITQNKRSGVRPYRFVWLDGCSTANGDWPGAFGVNKATNGLSYYTSATTNPSRRRPSAFVGWIEKIGGEGWGTVQDFWHCRTEWMFDWQQNWTHRTLVQALENGRNNSNWVPPGQFEENIRVYGYTALKMNEYNQKNDWPGP